MTRRQERSGNNKIRTLTEKSAARPSRPQSANPEADWGFCF
jgi:hypothetical protein